MCPHNQPRAAAKMDQWRAGRGAQSCCCPIQQQGSMAGTECRGTAVVAPTGSVCTPEQHPWAHSLMTRGTAMC